MQTLKVGDRFPALRAQAVDGSSYELPDELHGVFGVLLFYRGHW